MKFFGTILFVALGLNLSAHADDLSSINTLRPADQQCCRAIKTCTLQAAGVCNDPANPGQQAYTVWQKIMDCSGKQIGWNSIAEDLCRADVIQLLASPACN